MRDAAFPSNMPGVWSALWGNLPDETGTPVVIGEWGGLWQSTAVWQNAMVSYLKRKHIGWFYWALNDNSFKTGGLCASRGLNPPIAGPPRLACYALTKTSLDRDRSSAQAALLTGSHGEVGARGARDFIPFPAP